MKRTVSILSNIEEDAVLKVLEKAGYKWCAGEIPTWNRYLANNCSAKAIIICLRIREKLLSTVTITDLRDMDSEIKWYETDFHAKHIDIRDLKEML